jgi:hypothetical protein
MVLMRGEAADGERKAGFPVGFAEELFDLLEICFRQTDDGGAGAAQADAQQIGVVDG